MQKKHWTLGRIVVVSSIVLMAIGATAISSCNAPKKKTQVYDFVQKTATSPCAVKLLSTQVQDTWVNGNMTDPLNQNHIVFMDILTSYDPISQNMTVYVQGVDGSDKVVPNSVIKIFEGTACTPPTYTTIPQHVYLKLSDLNIINNRGQLNNFDFVALTPDDYSADPSIMDYSFSVSTGRIMGPTIDGLPCPPCPNCKPPCPEGCTPPCRDTTMGDTSHTMSADGTKGL